MTCPFALGARSVAELWPLLCAGPRPRLFCAGLTLCSGPALTTRGRHASTARLSHLGTKLCRGPPDRPLLRWAHDLRLLGPYFVLGRVLASFALGSHSVAGRPLLRGAATLQRHVYPTCARSRVGDRPLLRWAHDLRLLGPYLALGRDLAFFALGSHSVAGRPLLCGAATLQRLVYPTCARSRVRDRPLLRWAHDLRTLALTLRWAESPETLPLLRRAQSLWLALTLRWAEKLACCEAAR